MAAKDRCTNEDRLALLGSIMSTTKRYVAAEGANPSMS